MSKRTILILSLIQILLMSNLCKSQFEFISDSKHIHFIGFKTEILPDQRTQIFIKSIDSTIDYLLLDTLYKTKQEIIFIAPKFYEVEKDNYQNMLIIKLPEDIKSGIYYLYFKTRKKILIL